MSFQVIEMPGRRMRRPLMERLVFNGIVFNMSWEDPEMDRRALLIGPDDTVISISSAGCNPLNFLCQSPKRLISIDMNPAQNAILELKLAAIASLDWQTFFDIFSAQKPAVVTQVYRSHLRPRLVSARSKRFWDQKLWCLAQNLYDHGRMGVFCRMLRLLLTARGIPQRMRDEFFELRSLEEQRTWYHRHVAPRLWGKWSRTLVRFQPFLWLAGVHPQQFRLVDGRHDIFEYVRERVEYALTRVPVYDNYFLSVAATGKMRGDRVPPYLLQENFETLRRNLDRVEVVTGWLGPYLDAQPAGSIHKFNLLDIFDWMKPSEFEATLNSVLRVAGPNARLIYRSGSYGLEPAPSIRKRLIHHERLSRELLAIDRSATYGSFYVFSVDQGQRTMHTEPLTAAAAG